MHFVAQGVYTIYIIIVFILIQTLMITRTSCKLNFQNIYKTGEADWTPDIRS